MNATPFIAAAAVAAALFSVAASAQTGRPSDEEIGQPSAPASVVDTANGPVGSYARYLMLNGKTRDEAVAEAKAYDQPKHYPRFVFHGKPSKTTAPAATQAQ
jgi:hypothetical protein